VIGTAIDSAMDLAVAPGYTKIGFRARRALGWKPLEPGCMRGRRVIVTGASSGLGLATARTLRELGAHVHILVRDRGRGESAAEQIAGSGEGGVEVESCDLSSLSSIRSFATRFSSSHRGLDVLINNAGVMAGERDLSVDGYELTFATNVLGMFVLTNELLSQLVSAAPSRIINVSSGGMYTARLDATDLESARGDYDGPRAYAHSKRAEVVLTELWAERLRGWGIVVHAMHPGWADTPGVQRSLPRFHRITGPLLRSAEEGSDTISWLAAAAEPAQSTGLFWHDRRPRSTHRVPWTHESEADRRALWEACVLAGGSNSSRTEDILSRDSP
jgi:NAD(P)-dependent dehydrogenase (short-subunit alcohol dehydrogenase family)